MVAPRSSRLNCASEETNKLKELTTEISMLQWSVGQPCKCWWFWQVVRSCTQGWLILPMNFHKPIWRNCLCWVIQAVQITKWFWCGSQAQQINKWMQPPWLCLFSHLREGLIAEGFVPPVSWTHVCTLAMEWQCWHMLMTLSFDKNHTSMTYCFVWVTWFCSYLKGAMICPIRLPMGPQTDAEPLPWQTILSPWHH